MNLICPKYEKIGAPSSSSSSWPIIVSRRPTYMISGLCLLICWYNNFFTTPTTRHSPSSAERCMGSCCVASSWRQPQKPQKGFPQGRRLQVSLQSFFEVTLSSSSLTLSQGYTFTFHILIFGYIVGEMGRLSDCQIDVLVEITLKKEDVPQKAPARKL